MASHLPLNALRAFETAARTGSFSNAAREMGVSSAAVSQQVRLLEEFWGMKLFIRQGNRLALTEAGQSAYPQLGQSMAQLGALSDTMRRVEQKRIVDRNAGLRVEASSMARNFAEQAFGVALVPERMAQESLRAGRLVRLAMTAIPMKHDYLVAHPKRLGASHIVQAVIEALKA